MNANYINYLTAMKKSENTIKNYTRYVEQMLAFVGKEDADITYTDLMNWQASISHLSGNSVCLQIAAIKSYFKFLSKTKAITEDPSNGLERPRKHPKEKPYMDATTIRKLINASRTDRDRAILLTFCTTGLRVSELIGITLAQFDKARANREITITGKGAKTRTVYLNDEVMDAIEQYLDGRNDDCPYLFASFRRTQLDAESFSKTIKTTAKRAGIPFANEMSNHVLRSAFATSQSEAGTPVADIQIAMGHSSLAVTSLYIKHSQDRINQAMAKSAF